MLAIPNLHARKLNKNIPIGLPKKSPNIIPIANESSNILEIFESNITPEFERANNGKNKTIR